ncbi:hypothetical protein A2U01_0071685, partial [Trifolium medium]|nr:hypothetical protein [Trifolium medium]
MPALYEKLFSDVNIKL